DWETKSLASFADRGKRSAIGIHGFDHGGLLVDGGKHSPWDSFCAPLLARLDFPHYWRGVLVGSLGGPGEERAPRGRGVEKRPAEAEEFEKLRATRKSDLARIELLCRLVLLGILPAAEDGDLRCFSEAVYEYNRRVGEWFAPVQGGIYAFPETEAIIDYLR